MEEQERIVDQMRRAHLGASWTGASLVPLLERIDWRHAAARPVPNAHTIWEIVRHLLATQRLLVDLLDGAAPAEAGQEDWPPVGAVNAEAWTALLEEFRDGEAAVRRATASLPVEVLDEPLRPGGSSAYNNLHGYVQHALYHGGQISVLASAARAAFGPES